MHNRDRIHAALRDIALATVPVVGALLCFALWPARAAIQSNAAATAALIQKANSSLDGVNATLSAINAPCTSFHGSATCGPIAQLSQTEKNIGILAGQGALQVRQSGQLVDTASSSLTAISSHLSDAVDLLGGTARSSTATLDAGRSYFIARQPQIDLMLGHVNDLGDRSTRSLDLINARLSDPSLALIEERAAAFIGTGDHMLSTADQVETKLSACTLHPTFVCHAKAYTMFGVQAGGYLLQAIPK